MNVRSWVSSSAVVATLILFAACATQKSAPTPVASPPAAVQPAPVAAKPIRNPADITINELLDEPKKLEVFRKHEAIVADNPQISQARGMSLGEVAGYATEILTPAVLKAIAEDLSKL